MRVSSSAVSPSFTPFELKLTVRTLEEAQALYFVFNFSPLVDLHGDRLAAEKARRLLRKHAGTDVAAKFGDHEDKLRESFRK